MILINSISFFFFSFVDLAIVVLSEVSSLHPRSPHFSPVSSGKSTAVALYVTVHIALTWRKA